MILDRLYEEGTMNLSLTGGEIFLYPYFKEIYQYAKSKGFLIELKTNGLLINNSWIKTLKDHPPDEINITVYGLNNEDYYTFTGSRKGFDELRCALDLLYKNEINFSLQTIATTLNYEDILNGAYSSFFNNYDLEFEFDYDVLNSRDGDSRSLKYRLDADQIVKIENSENFYLNAIEQEYSAVINKNGDPFLCYAGKSKICIDPDAKASSCSFDLENKIDFISTPWNVLKEYLAQRNVAINELYVNSKCHKCNTGLLCRKCPLKTERLAMAEIEVRCNLSELRNNKIDELKETYNIKLDAGQIGKFKTIYINLSIENLGIDAKKKQIFTNYFASITNPEVSYILNGFTVAGSKGKSVFYIPILDDALAQTLNIPKGHALKIIRDRELLSSSNDNIVKSLNDMQEISNRLFLRGLAPECYNILLLRNAQEFSAFCSNRLIYYPENSVFFALEVQHLESIEFGEIKNIFNGKIYNNDILSENISDYLKSLNIVPFGLWAGNLLNTPNGIMLIDFFKWTML
jgi:MoaA/NifB/PqqE/SkfB family radical SAM enzyme